MERLVRAPAGITVFPWAKNFISRTVPISIEEYKWVKTNLKLGEGRRNPVMN